VTGNRTKVKVVKQKWRRPSKWSSLTSAHGQAFLKSAIVDSRHGIIGKSVRGSTTAKPALRPQPKTPLLDNPELAAEIEQKISQPWPSG
jgi:hypothetical protein